jgi:hypothetical protein
MPGGGFFCQFCHWTKKFKFFHAARHGKTHFLAFPRALIEKKRNCDYISRPYWTFSLYTPAPADAAMPQSEISTRLCVNRIVQILKM